MHSASMRERQVDDDQPTQTDGVAPMLEAPVCLPPSFARLGRYLLLERVGIGGMGVVFRAYDPQLSREVALKTLRLDLGPDANDARMLREARAMAQLSHRNVVQVFDFDTIEIDGHRRILLVMELVHGVDLAKWLRDNRPGVPEILAVFARAARGLQASHDAGLLHRDFKPTNVLVSRELDRKGRPLRVRVADFGLACAGGEEITIELRPIARSRPPALTDPGMAMGTALYMAPEQHCGHALAPATDQYAFCVALWQALTGRYPFDATGPELAQLKVEGPPAFSGRSGVPRRVIAALQRGLSPRPEDRWPNMTALRAELVPGRLGWRPRAAAMVGLTGVGAIVAGSLASASSRPRCEDGGAALGAAWDDARREAGREAFATTGVAFAEPLWNKLELQLDAYASQWVEGHDAACRDTHVRGEQSERDLDLRMACLRRARQELDAATELLGRADAAMLGDAHRVIEGLPAIEPCWDPQALREDAPPPALVPEIAEIERALATAHANREAGRFETARQILAPLSSRAEALAYQPLSLRIDLERGEVFRKLSHDADARAALEDAVRRAAELHDATAAADAALRLVDITNRDRPKVANGFSRLAKGFAAASDLRERLEARWWFYAGERARNEGREAEALAALERALEGAQSEVSGTKTDRAAYFEMSIRNSLGMLLARMGRLEEAEHQHRLVLTDLQTRLGPRHPAVGSAYSNLSQALADRDQFEEAERMAVLALAIKKEAYGEGHPTVARAYRNLANLLGQRGAMEEAIQAGQAEVRVQERANGPRSFGTAEALDGLGVSLRRAGRLDEAVDVHRRAVEILVEQIGTDHFQVAALRGNLANSLYIADRHDEAEVENREVVRIFTLTAGPNHRFTRRAQANLAAVLRATGDYAEAESLLRAVIEGNERTLGPESADLRGLRGNLGNLLRDLGRLDEALVEHEFEVRAMTQRYGPDHPATATALLNRAYTQAKRGHPTVARADMRAALEIRTRALGEDHYETLEAREALAELQHAN